MRKKLLIIFALLTLGAYGQDYSHIDNKVRNYPEFPDINTLVIRVSNDFATDEERVRAFYVWITDNVSYNTAAYRALQNKIQRPTRIVNSSYRGMLNREQQVVESVFKRRKTMCFGFSMLFKALCERSGIPAEVIRGIAKVDENEINEVRDLKDHAWNAVQVNGEWKLVDLTWSTGFADPGTGKWVRKLDDYYFFTPPHIFNTTHYPECSFWQLTDEKMDLQEFFNRPIFYRKYFESGIGLGSHKDGVISVSQDGRKIYISFSKLDGRPELYYTLSGDRYLKHVRVKREDPNQYTAVVNLGSNTEDVLTIYLKNQPLIGFKVKK